MFELISEDDLIFKQIVVVCQLFIKFDVLAVSRLEVRLMIFHLFFCIFGPVTIEIEYCL